MTCKTLEFTRNFLTKSVIIPMLFSFQFMGCSSVQNTEQKSGQSATNAQSESDSEKNNPYVNATPAEVNSFKRTDIPLPIGTAYKVSQGPYGCCTHNQKGYEYAWDFDVPFGTSVLSVEDGRVVQVYEPEGTGACNSNLSSQAHNIKILHADQTVAQYVHVQSRVKMGDDVKKGDIIGVTANNGYLCTPQLHFNIFSDPVHLPENNQPVTRPLTFRQIPNGILKKGDSGVVTNGFKLPAELPSIDLRGKVFDRWIQEIERLDGEGLLVRKNRPESFKKTTAKLRANLLKAKNWIEFGHVFKMLDATYPNLHASLYLPPELDPRFTEGRISIAASFGPDIVLQNTPVAHYRIGNVINALFENSSIEKNLRPQQRDELLAINNRGIKSWADENFIFCKFPLREQCEAGFFDNFRKEFLSWTRTDELTFTLKRSDHVWTVSIPHPVRKSQSQGSDVDPPCGEEKPNYPGFQRVFSGYHACAYENSKYPNTTLLRIRSFRYYDAGSYTKFKDPSEEAEAFWNQYWKEKSPTTQHLIIDVIDNGGGDSTMSWYKLFLQNKFQDQYVTFKKTREFNENTKMQDALFYSGKGKALFLEKLKSSGEYSKIKEGQFLPPVAQFCLKNDEDCDSLYSPIENQFKGDIKILVNQECISSCTGFVWTLKNELKDRVAFFGIPDSGDSSYGRVLLDLYLDSDSNEGFHTQVAPRIGQTKNKIPEGALFRQSLSVSKSTDRMGHVISGIPVSVKTWVPYRFHYFDMPWEESVLEATLKDIKR